MKTVIVNALWMSLLAGCGSSAPQVEETLAPPSQKALALGLLQRGLVEGDADFIREHVAPGYIQHNPTVADGRDGLLELVAFLQGLEAEFTIDVLRVLEEEDLVAVHSVQTLGGERTVAFDLFRFQSDGRFAEHWDGLQPWVETTVSGRTMVDGPTEVVDPDRTATHRKIVVDFVTEVFVNGRLEKIAEYLGPEYRQHNPQIGDGVDALLAFFTGLTEQNIAFGYTRLHRVVAEGNFVLTLSEGAISGQRQAFYDLWRVEEDRIVEHWDVVQPVPEEMAHANGMF